MQLQQGFLV
uniref:Uncharacterized protein n=1 Tax=Rhizophora mucronata TaxID=61149 RepID=A0A2P2KDM5_RHIMU